MINLLTDTEIADFNNRHWLLRIFSMIPEQGRLVPDDLLGCVLVYPKTDGTLLYIQTDLFPNCQVTDPNALIYVLKETAQAVLDNTINLPSNLSKLPERLDIEKYLILIVVILGLYFLIQVNRRT